MNVVKFGFRIQCKWIEYEYDWCLFSEEQHNRIQLIFAFHLGIFLLQLYRRRWKAVNSGHSGCVSANFLFFCVCSHGKVSKHWVPMLFLLNLHWQAALTLFYVFLWLFLVSTATDCTWWQAIGCYNVIWVGFSFCHFPSTLYSDLMFL